MCPGRDRKDKGRILWIQEEVSCFKRAYYVQGRFQLGLNFWRKGKRFERKGTDRFKKSLEICQVNKISRKGEESYFFFFLSGLTNSKTTDTYWRILIGEPPAVWLAWGQPLSSLNCLANSLSYRIYLRAGLELPSGILVFLEH